MPQFKLFLLFICCQEDWIYQIFLERCLLILPYFWHFNLFFKTVYVRFCFIFSIVAKVLLIFTGEDLLLHLHAFTKLIFMNAEVIASGQVTLLINLAKKNLISGCLILLLFNLCLLFQSLLPSNSWQTMVMKSLTTVLKMLNLILEFFIVEVQLIYVNWIGWIPGLQTWAWVILHHKQGNIHVILSIDFHKPVVLYDFWALFSPLLSFVYCSLIYLNIK